MYKSYNEKARKIQIHILCFMICFIFCAFGYTEAVVVAPPILEEPILEEPILEEPILEEPILEEPIVEEPIVEEPIVEEPKTKEQTIDGYVDDICKIYKVKPSLIKSIIWQESRYEADAINYNRTCFGLMQVSAYWHQDRMLRLGVHDLFDPYSNILVGVDYLSELLEKYGDIELVLMLYSMPHKQAFTLHKKGESSEYVKSVLSRVK